MFAQIYTIIQAGDDVNAMHVALSGISAAQLSELRSATLKQEFDKYNLLHLAAYYGRSNICQALVGAYGFHFATPSTLGRTAFHLASANGHIEVMDYLLVQTATLNRDKSNYSPLDYYLRYLQLQTETGEAYQNQRAQHHQMLRAFKKYATQFDFAALIKHIENLLKYHRAAAKTVFRSLFAKTDQYCLSHSSIKRGCLRQYATTVLKPFKVNFADVSDSEKLKLVEHPLVTVDWESRKIPGHTKHTFYLGEEHLALRAGLPSMKGRDGNFANASLTFLLKVTSALDGQAHFEKVTVPLFIPTDKGLSEPYLNFDDVLSCNPEAYSKLKALYKKGRTMVHGHHKHGGEPSYDNPDAVGKAQAIKHTEQSLAAYLYSDRGVNFIIQQLVDFIRNRGESVASLGDTLKVLGLVLNFHSVKTPCAPCEYVLIGLTQHRALGFLGRLQNALNAYTAQHLIGAPSSYFKFTYPKAGINLHVLYSALEKDGHHAAVSHVRTAAPTKISIKNAAPVVYCTVFQGAQYQADPASVADSSLRSVLLSGGSSADKIRKTKSYVTTCLTDGAEALALSFAAACLKPQIGDGLLYEEVRGDGNCLFRALSRILHGTEERHATYRRLAVDYMGAHRAQILPFFAGNGLQLNQYLANMQKQGVWGDMLEIYAMAKALNRTIVIVYVDRSQAPTTINPEASEPIFLAYHYGLHYGALSLKSGASAAEVANALKMKDYPVAKVAAKGAAGYKHFDSKDGELSPEAQAELDLQHAIFLSLLAAAKPVVAALP